MDESEFAVAPESEVTLRVVLEQDAPVRYVAEVVAEVVVDAEELEQLTAGGIEQLAVEQALTQAARAVTVDVDGLTVQTKPRDWRLLSITDDGDTEY